MALLWLSGAALRLTVLAVPPVIPLIQADLKLSGTEIGVLTGLPVILFALVALPGALMIARLGAFAALVVGLAVAAIGSALRGAAPSVLPLYAATIVMAAGIAVMQPALPALVRRWAPAEIGFGTAVFTNGLLVGEIIPVALTLPVVMPLAGGSWRWSLAAWAIPLGVVAVLLMALAPRTASGNGVRAGLRWWPDWRAGLTWRLGLILASISAAYFASNAFVPGHLTQAGRPDLIRPVLTALNIAQLPASFGLIAVAHRIERQVWPYLVLSGLTLAGVIGIPLSASGWTVFHAAVLGFAGGGSLALALALPPLLCAPEDVARTSAAQFTLGYGGAMLVSVAGGAAWDLTGSASFAFLPIALGVLPMLALTPTLALERSG